VDSESPGAQTNHGAAGSTGHPRVRFATPAAAVAGRAAACAPATWEDSISSRAASGSTSAVAHQNIHVALTGPGKDRPALVVPGGRWPAIEPVPGDAPSARWEVPVTVRRGADGFDFSGPFVRGDRTDRHLGLAWGDVPGDGTLRLFRGAKLRLADIDSAIIEAAIRPGHRLVARIRLTDARGNPVCARVRPPALTWSAEPG
jgi:uncharacterized Zn-binding protein involved in type VI secretion